jgi:hypothetical protein
VSFALQSNDRSGACRGESSRVVQAAKLTGLEAADHRVLADWLDSAEGAFDTVVDRAARRWRIDGARAIIGVFERGKPHASWLMVRGHAGWVVARCEDGFISDVSTALPEILELIDMARLKAGSQRQAVAARF